MKPLKAYIQLARPVNLLIIILTQVLFWSYIVMPVYEFFNLSPGLNLLHIMGIVLSTVLIAAGGYVINDYYDLPIDLVNKPDKVIISKDIDDNAAFNYYIALTAGGLASALGVAISIGKLNLVLFPFIIASMLWFYAQRFKRTFLVGNLIVALLTVGVIFILLLFEVDWAVSSNELSPEINEILKFGLAYMVFAFLTTMLREVVKDLQDREGDAQFECRTLPVVWGVAPGKAVSLLWLGITMVLIGWLTVEVFNAENYPAAFYLSIFLLIPGGMIGYKIVKAKESAHFKKMSAWIKAFMMFGILTMIYVGIILGKHG